MRNKGVELVAGKKDRSNLLGLFGELFFRIWRDIFPIWHEKNEGDRKKKSEAKSDKDNPETPGRCGTQMEDNGDQ